MDGIDAAAREVIEEMAKLSGLILWRVKIGWANKGQKGVVNQIVKARTAVEAVQLAWSCEDDRDIRTVEVEWLGPVESVIE